MKKISYIIAVIALQATAAVAHEHGPGASTSGLFGLKPEYVHVLINPLPVYGVAVGLAVLAFGFIRRSTPLCTTGLIISAFCAASAWPVLYYGQHAYNSLAPMLDTESEQWLDSHMERAERFVYFFYATAALGIAALIFSKKSPKARTVLSVLTFAVGLASFVLGAWISRAGGQISHSEFRAEGVAPPSSDHKHGTHEESSHSGTEIEKQPDHKSEHPTTEHAHTETQSATTNAAHEHHAETNQPEPASASTNAAHEHVHPSPGATNAPAAAQAHEHPQEQPQAHAHAYAPSAPGEWLPDAPEGIWAALHQRHDLFAQAITANDTGQIHGNAVAIEKLANALVSVVHPDHKAAVQKGADQIIAAVKAAHKSAHAEDAAGLESNFKLFEQSLNELEQQMKKQ